MHESSTMRRPGAASRIGSHRIAASRTDRALGKDDPMTERPIGTVTFLITDIEGSTQRWEHDPETMRTSVAQHDMVLRTAIEANGGWPFKNTGDGILAAFSSARSAIDAAIAAQ